MDEKKEKSNTAERPPVVVVMGHIDHGKSTLLDYIRSTNTVEKEAGGITQRISAYEVLSKKEKKKITFVDTPGHEAFTKMRERGARVADIAILVVSAEDGVKPQTIEAWKTICESDLPSIVAINKIDKPNANIEKTKTELAEQEIYLENYGGKVPCVEISAKTGAGVEELLSLILILSEMENLTGDPREDATGAVIEAKLDPRCGIEATLIIKNGTLKRGMCVAVKESVCNVRTMENFKGESVNQVSFSSPVRIVGFDKIPQIGVAFKSFPDKINALTYAQKYKKESVKIAEKQKEEVSKKIVPIILKADNAGSIEAIETEIGKIKQRMQDGSIEFKIIWKGAGGVSESDIKKITIGEDSLIIAFNVKADKNALEMAQKRGIAISFFDIIYKLSEWLEAELEKRRPRIETQVITGKAKIIRAFSRSKERQIVGGKVTEGSMALNGIVKIMRREFEIGRGKIVNLEKSKIKTSEVSEGAEFGMMLESKTEIVAGDSVEAFSVVQK